MSAQISPHFLQTHERFIGFLIEHYAGNFPLWLAPDQVRVITLNDEEALIAYATPIVAELRANMVRVDADYSATPFNSDKSRAGAKISNAERSESFPPPHVVGYGWSSAVATWTPAR